MNEQGGSDRGRRPRLLILALSLQGISGIAGGTGLLLDPSGRALSIPIEWLQGSPFSDYAIPGVVLLLALGFGPLAVAYLLGKRHAGAVSAALLVGLALLVWLGVQIAVIGYQPRPPLQLGYGVLGAIIVVLAIRQRRSTSGERARK